MSSTDEDEIEIIQSSRRILEYQSPLALATVFPAIYADPTITRDFAGSAFLLFDLVCGQMVFATAKHILEPLYEKRATEAFVLVPHLDNDKPSRTHVAALRINGVSVAKHHSDVALIRCDKRTLQEGEQLAYSTTTIKVAPAVIDEVTLGLGFARHLVTEDFNFTRDFRASHGVVTELFDAGRGTNELVNFPSFRTSAFYDSGMSGGPVIDQTGKCIGIISDGRGACNACRVPRRTRNATRSGRRKQQGMVDASNGRWETGVTQRRFLGRDARFRGRYSFGVESTKGQCRRS